MFGSGFDLRVSMLPSVMALVHLAHWRLWLGRPSQGRFPPHRFGSQLAFLHSSGHPRELGFR